MRPTGRVLLGGALVLVAALAPGRADAHPLGNLTVNASVDVVLRTDRIDATYVLDLAELPTVQARQQIAPAGGADAWAAQRCDRLAAGVTIGGGPLAVVGAPALAFPPGQGGLDTLRLVCPLGRAGGVTTAASLDIVDGNDTDRIGWREIVVRGDGVTITAADAPSTSPSALLTAYPSDGSSPVRTLRAHADVRPGGAAAAAVAPARTERAQGRGADALTRRMNRLVSDHRLTVPLAALAVALALVLGGFHALAPGHGKTLMAATVVARRGAAARQVLTIGATVAATHTTGVLVLGLAIWTSQAVAPERVLPWLTLASGALLVATGTALLVRRLRNGPGHHHHGVVGHGRAHHAEHAHDDHAHDDHAHDDHAHDDHAHPHPDHEHDHHDHPHHGHDHHEHAHHGHDHHEHAHQPTAAPLSRRWLVTMGFAGGMVPTPSALVVLLGATALGRAWFGVLLVAVYGVGMAGTLMAAGVALVRLQGWLERRWFGSRWLGTTLRFAPIVTAMTLMIGGVTLALRSLPGV